MSSQSPDTRRSKARTHTLGAFLLAVVVGLGAPAVLLDHIVPARAFATSSESAESLTDDQPSAPAPTASRLSLISQCAFVRLSR